MIPLTWLMALTSLQLKELREVYLSAFLDQHRLSEHDLIAYYDAKMLPRFQGNGPLCVVLDQGHIVGFAAFEKWDASSYYLAEMAIAPKYQRQGLGKQLVFSVFEKDPACHRILLVTERANTWSQSFYEAIGFKPSSFKHPDYPLDRFTSFEYSVSRSAK